jgi:DNA-directed RNA polymerase subunit RPC12/RpoP
MSGKRDEVSYRCHECGSPLEAFPSRKMLACLRCCAWRRVPTHPALIVRVARAVQRPDEGAPSA